MPSTDLLLNYWPGWLSLTVAVLLVTNKLIEESYKFASAFGKIGKSIHARALARHHVDLAASQFAAAVKDAVNAARKEWEQEDNEAIRALDDRLGTVSRVTADQKSDIDDLLFQVHCLTSYTDYEGVWHNRFRAIAARGNGRMNLTELPGHMLYYEFEEQFKLNTKWREWSDL